MGHGHFLRLVGALKSSGLPVQAVLIGGGPLLESLKRQAAAMGLRDQLRFTGALPYEQVEEWYRWAHLFVFMGIVAGSGDRAGLPNALAEAMAWGVPVVASRVGAVPEAVRPGVTGILHEDMASTVGAVRTVLADPEAYAALRAGARAWVEEAYDGKRNMADLAELILKAHRQSRGSGA
jgi:glycosyltransferase involved in cell wall biosynthesis